MEYGVRPHEAEEALRSITNALGKLIVSTERFSRSYQSAIETEYLKNHRRLPGGTSNERLQKKRFDYITRWFDKQP